MIPFSSPLVRSSGGSAPRERRDRRVCQQVRYCIASEEPSWLRSTGRARSIGPGINSRQSAGLPFQRRSGHCLRSAKLRDCAHAYQTSPHCRRIVAIYMQSLIGENIRAFLGNSPTPASAPAASRWRPTDDMRAPRHCQPDVPMRPRLSREEMWSRHLPSRGNCCESREL